MMNLNLEKIIEQTKKSSPIIIIGLVILLLSSITTISKGINIIINYYNNTLGYKNKLINKIEKFSTDTNIEYFENLIGTPIFINNLKGKKIEYIFTNKYFYLQVITDENDKVLAFSLTTRRNDFNPKLILGPYTTDNKTLIVKLGKTKFSELDEIGFGPPKIHSFLGAHDFFYSEEYYFGNPGLYQTYIFSINQSGYLKFDRDTNPLFVEKNEKVDINNPKIKEFRNSGIINTYTITAPLISGQDFEHEYFGGFIWGPDYNQVRILSN